MVTHDPEMGQRARRQLHMMDGRLDVDELSRDQISSSVNPGHVTS